MFNQCRQNCVILKPDKGNGIVLINKNEYNLVMKLFCDRSKFKVIKEDLTLTRSRTVQNYEKAMLKIKTKSLRNKRSNYNQWQRN